jgi:hypothetical protein
MDLLYCYVMENIEPKGFSKEEFTRMLQQGNPLVVDALRNGAMVADVASGGRKNGKNNAGDNPRRR